MLEEVVGDGFQGYLADERSRVVTSVEDVFDYLADLHPALEMLVGGKRVAALVYGGLDVRVDTLN